MCRQKFSVDYLVCWYDLRSRCWKLFLLFLLEYSQSEESHLAHQSPGSGRHQCPADCREWYVPLNVLADAIPHGVIWLASSGVTSRELSSEKSAGSQYCASPAAWESNQAKPSFSRWSWEHETDGWVWSAALAHVDLMIVVVRSRKGNEQKSTDQDVTSSLLLPFEAAPDLTYSHVTLFLKTNRHVRTLADQSVNP